MGKLRILAVLLANMGHLLGGRAVVIIDQGDSAKGLFGSSIPTKRLRAILMGFNRQIKRSAKTA